MKENPLTIAITGKGGVGKTVITALLAKVITQTYKYKLNKLNSPLYKINKKLKRGE